MPGQCIGFLMVGGGKMIPHSGREFPQEESQEQGVVFVAVGGEEGQHLIHHLAGPVVSQAGHAQQRKDLLPSCHVFNHS
jgi:hypothetical protein